MHDMSNTRKEIADRLGFAAGNGAKTTMAKPPRKYEHGDRVYIMDGNKRVGSGVIDYMFDYDDFVGTYIYKVRQEDGGRASYNETSLKKMSRPGAKTRMTREQTEEQKAGLKIMSAADPAVGAKIATLIKEGKPQDQAVAIALDMKRRGEL